MKKHDALKRGLRRKLKLLSEARTKELSLDERRELNNPDVFIYLSQTLEILNFTFNAFIKRLLGLQASAGNFLKLFIKLYFFLKNDFKDIFL